MTHRNQATGGTTGGLSFEEDPEEQVILCTTPKRRQKIKVFIPVGNSISWRITYEDGNPVPNLSNGCYLSRSLALKAVTQWERSTKKTITARQFELFGDREPPVLRRKKIRGSRAKTNSG